jgi:hypothetical protein
MTQKHTENQQTVYREKEKYAVIGQHWKLPDEQRIRYNLNLLPRGQILR